MPHREDPCAAIREEFSALLDDELGPARRAEVEAHLSGCAACLRELDAMKRVSDLYATLPPVAAPADFETRVRAAVQPPSNVVPWSRRRGVALFTFAVAAAAGLVLVALPGLLERNAANAPDRMQTARQDSADGAGREADAAEDKVEEATAKPAELWGYAATPAMENAPVAAAESGFDQNTAKPPVPSAGGVVMPRESKTVALSEAVPAPSASSPMATVESGDFGSLRPEPERAQIADDEARENRIDTMPPPAAVAAAPPAPPAPPALAPMPAPARMAKGAPARVDEAKRSDKNGLGKTKELADKKREAPADWQVADRRFVLIDGRWLQGGEIPAGTKPKALQATSREFKRLVREFPLIEQLATASLPVVFSVGDQWYELKPKKS